MIVKLEKFKKIKKQDVTLEDGINLLVGANGSGKSSLLEYLFAKEDIGLNRIAYSSGVNESYSKIYSPILSKKYKSFRSTYYSFGAEKPAIFDDQFCIYLDKTWAPFLIVTALYLKNSDTSLCGRWMQNLSLKVFSLKYSLNFSRQYRSKVETSISESEQGKSFLGFQSSKIHRFVSKLSGGLEGVGTRSNEEVEIGTGDIYDKGGVVNKEITDFLFKNELLADGELFAGVDPKKYSIAQQNEIQLINFFSLLQTVAFGKTPVIDLQTTDLIFKNSTNDQFGLNDLSDGEFQLLTTSALIDLFGDEKSLLILDEIDAHIHPSIIRKIWAMLEPLKTKILTSSHNMMSLSLTDINRIRFLEDGTILNESRKKKGVIESLYGAYFSPPVAQSLYYSCENLFILDGHNDWQLLKSLCKRAGKRFEEIEENCMIIPVSSSTQKANGFDEMYSRKIDWVKNFKNSLLNLDLDSRKIRLKNFILICDKDDLDLSSRTKDQNCDLFYNIVTNGIKKVKGFSGTIHLIVLNRRNIESYFISKSAREELSDEISEESIIKDWEVSETDYKKNEDKYRRSYIGKQIRNLGPLFADSDSFNSRSIEEVDGKRVIHSFISDKNGINEEKVDRYLSKMKDSDLDPYLGKMFDKIKSIISTN